MVHVLPFPAFLLALLMAASPPVLAGEGRARTVAGERASAAAPAGDADASADDDDDDAVDDAPDESGKRAGKKTRKAQQRKAKKGAGVASGAGEEVGEEEERPVVGEFHQELGAVTGTAAPEELSVVGVTERSGPDVVGPRRTTRAAAAAPVAAPSQVSEGAVWRGRGITVALGGVLLFVLGVPLIVVYGLGIVFMLVGLVLFIGGALMFVYGSTAH